MNRVMPKRGFNFIGEVAGDKSITHRAVMLSALADGRSVIRKPLLSYDTLATVDCMRKLGANIQVNDNQIIVDGVAQLRSGAELYAANSGTTMRLLTGLIAGSGVAAMISGDESLSRRPMKRIAQPLNSLGANIQLSGGFAPIRINSSKMTGGHINLTVPSAQVKSGILLSGLGIEEGVSVSGAINSRNHTELMLWGMGADITEGNGCITVKKSKLIAIDITVAGDISTAAFLLCSAAINGSATVKNVGINPTRNGILNVLTAMGADVIIQNNRQIACEQIADITVNKSQLKPITLGGDIIANIIDELPIISVLMACAEGTSRVTGAEELKIKESNRIKLIVDNLVSMGVKAGELSDGFEIEGCGEILGGGNIVTNGDHRIAMSMAIAALSSKKGGNIDDLDCAKVSYPNFAEDFLC